MNTETGTTTARSTPRRDAILLSASEHFAQFGFRGASLRAIARDAGVSLPLLSHHFGDKTRLLSAVIAPRREMLEERTRVVARVTHAGAGTFTLRSLVEAWVRLAFDTAAEPDGERSLRLLARIIDDPAEDNVPIVRDQLDAAALAFIDALQQCYPQASRHAAASAYLCANASLSNFLTGAGSVVRLASEPRPPNAVDEARLASFLVAGIDAALSLPDGRVDRDDAVFPTLAGANRAEETI